MSKRDYVYYSTLTKLISNTLLHLQMERSYSARFIPPKRANEIVKKYLESIKSSAPYNKILKNEIRDLQRLCKLANGNVEVKLLELNELCVATKFNDVDLLYSLIDKTSAKLKLKNALLEERTDRDTATFYLSRENIEAAFNEEQMQVLPVEVYAPDEILSLVEAEFIALDLFSIVDHHPENSSLHSLPYIYISRNY